MLMVDELRPGHREAGSLLYKHLFRALRALNTYQSKKRIIIMLYTIAVVLILLWLLGLVTSYTMSGLIHVLLVIAVVVLLVRLIQGRKLLGSKN